MRDKKERIINKREKKKEKKKKKNKCNIIIGLATTVT